MRTPGRRVLAAALVLLLAPVACSDDDHGPNSPPAPPPSDLVLQAVAGTYQTPVLVTAPPADLTRLFILEKPGRIRVVKNGTLLTTPFLDISSRVAGGYEQGLLGLAFAPDYGSSGRFYVYYVHTDGNERISRFHVSGNPDVALAVEETLLTVPDPNEFHNAGMLAFGRDGMLYVAIGDGGGTGDPYDTGQDPSDLLGSILRIDVSGATGYSIPAGNPFSPPNRREVWCYGLRNPWRFTFDSSNGDLYIGDVGQDTWEEVDVATAASGGGRGRNFGWSVKEGYSCYGASSCNSTGLTDPVIVYDHPDGCTVIGGYVYRGNAMPGLRGTYFYADYCMGFVRSFVYSGGAATAETDWPALDPGVNVTSFGQDAAGELYLCTETGRVFKIVPP